MTKRAPVTAENREIGKIVAQTFGGEPSVHTYWDSGRNHAVDIMSCVGSPGPGLTAYSTLTLSNHALEGVENDLRVELLGACRSNVEGFPRVLSTCAFNIIENHALVGPGAVFQGAFTVYGLATTTPNILFVPPFIWGEEPRTQFMLKRTVAFLLALPISDAEFEHVKAEGWRSLMDLMEAERPNIFDLDRPSML